MTPFARSVVVLVLGLFLAGCCSIFPDLESCRPPPAPSLRLETYRHHNGAGTPVEFEILNEGNPVQAIGRQAIYAVRTKAESNESRTQRLWREDGYLAARLQIERVAGQATNATDPSRVERLSATVWNELQQYAALISVFDTQNSSAALVVPVVSSSRASNRAANPIANSGKFVMRPTIIGPNANYTIASQFAWGDAVDQKLVGVALSAMQTAAGMAVGIPAPIAAALAGISKDDRERADKFVSDALSTKVDDNTASFSFDGDSIKDGRAFVIIIFDRDTRQVTDLQGQTLLRYRIDFAPMLSILTADTKVDTETQNVMPNFSNFSKDNYQRPFVRDRPDQTPRALVQKERLLDQTNLWREYHRLCTEVSGIFSVNGFNAVDTQALRWAALLYAGQQLPANITDSDGRTPCPDSGMPMPSFNPPARIVP